jgi:tetratricopeptide (TPR) repeat protein
MCKRKRDLARHFVFFHPATKSVQARLRWRKASWQSRFEPKATTPKQKRLRKTPWWLGGKRWTNFIPASVVFLQILRRYFSKQETCGAPVDCACKRRRSLKRPGKPTELIRGSAYQNLAVIYVLEGRGRQALETVNRALAVWTQVLAPNHPFLVYALGTKIVAYKKLKMFQEAEDMIPQTLELCASRFGPDHPERVILLNNTASVYLADKKYAKAEPLLREAVELCRRKFAPGHPLLNSVLLNYSNVLRKLNRNEEASLARAQSEVVSAFPQQLKTQASSGPKSGEGGR